MQKWWRDPVLWLMVGSSLLVMLLSGLWLKSAYQTAKDDLRREASFLFVGAIRNLEDSLIQHTVINQYLPDSPRAVDIRVVADSTLQGKRIMQISRGRGFFGPPHDTLRNLRKRWHRHARNHPDGIFVGSLSLHVKVLQADVDSTRTLEIVPMLEQRTMRAFAAKSYPFSYHLFSEDLASMKDSTATHASTAKTLRTRLYHDVFGETQYGMELRDYRSYLMGKIKYQIAFSLVLLCLTFLTFSLSYRAIRKERRLTQMRKDLVSNITHELKTPIATVKVALESIQNFEAGTNPQKRAEYLAIANTELDRLTLLVENVLRTSIEEDRAMRLNFEKINLKELVAQIVKTMQLQFEKSGAQVNLHVGQDDMWIKGDRIHLISVIYNLLDNAIKYSTSPASIRIELQDQKDKYTLAVSDQGIGIAKHQHQRIFEKFYRVEDAEVHDTKGYGLGLNYVAQVIKKHSGSIAVKSELGQGSTFTIAFPALKGAL